MKKIIEKNEQDMRVEQQIKAAVSKATPDVLDKIFEEIDKADEVVPPSEDRRYIKMDNKVDIKKKKKMFSGLVAAAAVAVMLIGGGIGYQGAYGIDSVVAMDVNPSIELKLNKSDKIVKVETLNEDAATIVGDMDLKGVDLDIALRAIIGSMVEQGYISQLQNSILISVENGDVKKGEALEKQLTEKIDQILAANSINGAIIGQIVIPDAEDKKLSTDYGISVGKARLIRDIIIQMPTYTFEDLAGLPVNDLNLLIESRSIKLDNLVSKGTASDKTYIGMEKASEIAFKKAGATKAQVQGLEIEMDREDGRMVYEVEFYFGGKEFDYDIDALTGEIVSQSVSKADQDKINKNDLNKNDDDDDDDDDDDYDDDYDDDDDNDGNNKALKPIGKAAAKSFALAHAGLSAGQVTDLEVDEESDNGNMYYEVSFEVDDVDYEYEIHYETGAILKAEKK